MFDIKTWLVEMGFSEAEATEMAPKFEGEKLTRIETQVGLRSTTEAERATIAATQDKLKKANEKLDAELAEWATLSAAEKASATQLQADLEASRVRATQLETRLTNLATQHGVDPKTLLEGTAPMPEVKPAAVVPANDPKYVGLDTFGNVANFQMQLAGDLPYIAQQHFELTGERLDTRAIVAEVKNRATIKGAVIDPIAIWEEKYGIQAKREAKATEARAAEVAQAEARGYERARTESAIPGPQSPGRHSIVFGQRNASGVVEKPRESHLHRPQPGTTAMAAASALASGRYRQKVS